MDPSAFSAEVCSRVIDKETPILVGCRSGVRSLAAIQVLREAGYTNLSNVEGGFMAWAMAGLPIEKES